MSSTEYLEPPSPEILDCIFRHSASEAPPSRLGRHPRAAFTRDASHARSAAPEFLPYFSAPRTGIYARYPPPRAQILFDFSESRERVWYSTSTAQRRHRVPSPPRPSRRVRIFSSIFGGPANRRHGTRARRGHGYDASEFPHSTRPACSNIRRTRAPFQLDLSRARERGYAARVARRRINAARAGALNASHAAAAPSTPRCRARMVIFLLRACASRWWTSRRRAARAQASLRRIKIQDDSAASHAHDTTKHILTPSAMSSTDYLEPSSRVQEAVPRVRAAGAGAVSGGDGGHYGAVRGVSPRVFLASECPAPRQLAEQDGPDAAAQIIASASAWGATRGEDRERAVDASRSTDEKSDTCGVGVLASRGHADSARRQAAEWGWCAGPLAKASQARLRGLRGSGIVRRGRFAQRQSQRRLRGRILCALTKLARPPRELPLAPTRGAKSRALTYSLTKALARPSTPTCLRRPFYSPLTSR
ncbi:hypothetical protein FB451DRAFT_1373314 [Mycena latifolia]|nr:hypothetical protein FB451DRAFT_1373314 [Mycena latifolia]